MINIILVPAHLTIYHELDKCPLLCTGPLTECSWWPHKVGTIFILILFFYIFFFLVGSTSNEGLELDPEIKSHNSSDWASQAPLHPDFQDTENVFKSDSKAQAGFKLMFIGFQTYVFNYYITLMDWI